MTRSWSRALVDLALLALIGATVAAILASSPARPYVVAAAATLVPGGALLTRLRIGDGLTDLALAVGLSLAVDIAGSVALAWAGWWHPEALAIVLGGASAALLLGDLVVAGKR